MKQQMKKCVTAILLALVTFSVTFIAGCNSNSDKADYDSSSSESQEKDKNLIALTSKSIRTISAKNSPLLEYSYKDDSCYYYMFNLGVINNVPLQGFGGLDEYNSNVQKEIEFETSAVSESEISSSVSKTVQESTNTSSTKSVDLGLSFGYNKQIGFDWEFQINLAYSRTTSSSTSKAYTDSYTNASKYAETSTKKYKLDMTGAPYGFYGYLLTGSLTVHSFVVFDTQKSTYDIIYFSDVIEQWMGFYYFSSADEFLNYNNNTISFEVPENLQIPTEYITQNSPDIERIVIDMKRYNCADNNGYDKTQQAPKDHGGTRHDGYDLGNLLLYGCKKSDNIYVVEDANQFSVKFYVTRNLENLPRVGTTLTKISSDTATKVTGTDINSKIGCGAYWLRMTYTDGTQRVQKATNIFSNCPIGTYIELASSENLSNDKTLSKIEIVFAYELYCTGPGFLGIAWDEWSNWRCESTIKFI